MRGVITHFNPHAGEGTLRAEKDKEYVFTMAAWSDMSDMPSKGLVVDFTIDDAGNIIKAISQKIKTEIPQASEPRKEETPSKEGDQGQAHIPEILTEIHPTISVQETIQRFFMQISRTIDHYKMTLDAEKELDFLKMKRFLFTAYNNLYELDNSLTDSTMEKIKKELEALQKEYDLFCHKTRYPVQYTFEKIYLSNQLEYGKMEKALDHAQSQIKTFSFKEKPILDRLKVKEHELSMIRNSKSTEYERVEKQIKTIRKRYVDLLHHIAKLREERDRYLEITEAFKKKHLPEFISAYEPLSNYLDGKMTKILNVKAYQFDHELWSRAKKSKNIRQFFMDSGIEGTYSSKTFLKYYLRTLDKDKMNKENKGLYELLKYLESLGADSILVIRNSKDSAAKCKYLIENIDKEINVMITHDPADSFKFCLKERPDMIFLDTHLRTMSGFEYIDKYREKYPDEADTTTFCLFAEEISQQLLAEAKKHSVKHVIPALMNDTDTIDHLREIL